MCAWRAGPHLGVAVCVHKHVLHLEVLQGDAWRGRREVGGEGWAHATARGTGEQASHLVDHVALVQVLHPEGDVEGHDVGVKGRGELEEERGVVGGRGAARRGPLPRYGEGVAALRRLAAAHLLQQAGEGDWAVLGDQRGNAAVVGGADAVKQNCGTDGAR